MKRLLAFSIIGFIVILPVWGMTGEELLERCNRVTNELQNQNQPASYNSWWCLGYVKGYADAHTYSSVLVGRSKGKTNVTNADGIIYCPSGSVTYDQLATVFINYLKQHPEELRFETGVLVGRALANAFPCKQK